MKIKDDYPVACFTGHRNIKNPDKIRRKIKKTALELIDRGVKAFSIGGAYGFDCLAGEEILKIRQYMPSLYFLVILPCPFEIFTHKWNEEDKQKLEYIMLNAFTSFPLQNEYTKDCYKKRNQHLINNSRYCVCYYDVNNSRSGTAQTVRMAEKKGIEIINMFD